MTINNDYTDNMLKNQQNFNTSEGNVKEDNISEARDSLYKITVVEKWEECELEAYKDGWDECRKIITPQIRKHYKEFYEKKHYKHIKKTLDENFKLKVLLNECAAELEEFNNSHYPSVEKLLIDVYEVLNEQP